MKESTRQELLIVVENLPKPLSADCIVTLFDLYSTLEIQTIEDLFGDHSSF